MGQTEARAEGWGAVELAMDMRERIEQALQDAAMVMSDGTKISPYAAWYLTTAVLEAMREPTEEMLCAGVGRTVAQTWNVMSLEWKLKGMRDIWSNMIHATTKEKETA